MQADLKADLSPLDILRVITAPSCPDAMTKIEHEFAGELSQNFLGSHDPNGTAWQPLKRPRPPGHNPGVRPLIDFGDLFASVVSDGPDHIRRITGTEMVSGTTDEKAAIHQEGTDNIPARPFMGVNDTMADRAGEIIADDLLKQIGA